MARLPCRGWCQPRSRAPRPLWRATGRTPLRDPRETRTPAGPRAWSGARRPCNAHRGGAPRTVARSHRTPWFSPARRNFTNPLYAKWGRFAIRRTPLRFFGHLREDARDLQGPLGAEADAEPEQFVNPVALFWREVLQGLNDHARVGLHEGVPVVLQALKRLAPGLRRFQFALGGLPNLV